MANVVVVVALVVAARGIYQQPSPHCQLRRNGRDIQHLREEASVADKTQVLRLQEWEKGHKPKHYHYAFYKYLLAWLTFITGFI